MKKAFLFLLFAAFVTTAFAGRQTDMEFRLISPLNNVVVPPGSTFTVKLQAKNTGGDDLQGSDTLFLKLIVDGYTFPFANPSGGTTDTFLRFTGFQIAPGDSTIIFTQAFGINDSGIHNFCLEGYLKSAASTVSINDPNSANNKSCVQVNYATVGIATINPQKTLFEVYPMPANNVIHWNCNSDFKPTAIALYNLAGTCVKRTQVSATNNSLDVAHLPAGMYLLQATNKNGVVASWRLVKE